MQLRQQLAGLAYCPILWALRAGH